MTAYVNAIGITAPGLDGWPAARGVLIGDAAYEPAPLSVTKPRLLPRNEARRAGDTVKLAFRAAEQIIDDPRAMLPMDVVFASAGGDIAIGEQMCRAVVEPEPAVSPTRFHNSVHNAPAGYWGIASGWQQPAISLAAGRSGFAMALVDAWTTVVGAGRDVLLVCYEAQGCGLLQDARPSIVSDFALALRLSPVSDGALARLDNPRPTADCPDRLGDPALESLRRANSGARSLTVLRSVATGDTGTVVIESEPDNWAIDVLLIA